MTGLAGIEAAWDERKSARGFRPEPLARAELEQMFSAAQRAPSESGPSGARRGAPQARRGGSAKRETDER